MKSNMTRLRRRCRRGERLFGIAQFGKWQPQTFIAGLTSGALIASWVIKGAMDRIAFDTYIETQLAPALVRVPRDDWHGLHGIVGRFDRQSSGKTIYSVRQRFFA